VLFSLADLHLLNEPV
jgi:hypothetical protein